MIDLQWLTDRLCYILRWRMDRHPGAENDPDAPEIPPTGQRVWGLFLDLHATRSSNGFGANPISYAEIEAMSRMRREPVRPFELDIIRALDATWLEVAAAMAKEPDKPKVSSEKVTPALFKRLFG
jgi:hypothetical protein